MLIFRNDVLTKQASTSRTSLYVNGFIHLDLSFERLACHLTRAETGVWMVTAAVDGNPRGTASCFPPPGCKIGCWAANMGDQVANITPWCAQKDLRPRLRPFVC